MAQRFYWKQYVTDKQVTFYIADLILWNDVTDRNW